MFYDADEKLQDEARKRLGSQWARKLNTTLDNLIDAEGLLHQAQKRGNFSSSLDDVCDAIRRVLADRR